MPESTRSAIIRATILLFNQYGPMVPMSKISEHAGVAAGTPFRYFRTKEELLAAAYVQAHENTLRCSPQESIEGMDAEHVVKSIVRTIMKWSALCPQDLEYMRKYEDAVCYDCFSERFSETLYVGIIRDQPAHLFQLLGVFALCDASGALPRGRGIPPTLRRDCRFHLEQYPRVRGELSAAGPHPGAWSAALGKNNFQTICAAQPGFGCAAFVDSAQISKRI